MFGPATTKYDHQHQVERGDNQDAVSRLNVEPKSEELREQSEASVKFHQATSKKTHQECLKKSTATTRTTTENNIDQAIKRKQGNRTTGRRRIRTREEHGKLTCTTCCSHVQTPSSASSLSPNHSSYQGSSCSSASRSAFKSKSRSNQSESKLKAESNFESLCVTSNSSSSNLSSPHGSFNDAPLWSVFRQNNPSFSCLGNEINSVSDFKTSNLVEQGNTFERGGSKKRRKLIISTTSNQHKQKSDKRKQQQLAERRHNRKRCSEVNNLCANCDANLVTSSFSSNSSNTCSQCSLSTHFHLKFSPAMGTVELEVAKTEAVATSSFSSATLHSSSSVSRSQTSLQATSTSTFNSSLLLSESSSASSWTLSSLLLSPSSSWSSLNSTPLQQKPRTGAVFSKAALFSCSSLNSIVIVDSLDNKCECSKVEKARASKTNVENTSGCSDLQREPHASCQMRQNKLARVVCHRSRCIYGGCTTQKRACCAQQQQQQQFQQHHLGSHHRESVQEVVAASEGTNTTMELVREQVEVCRKHKKGANWRPTFISGKAPNKFLWLSLDQLNNIRPIFRTNKLHDQCSSLLDDSSQVGKTINSMSKTNTWPLLPLNAAETCSYNEKCWLSNQNRVIQAQTEEHLNKDRDKKRDKELCCYRQCCCCCCCCCCKSNRRRRKQQQQSTTNQYHNAEQQQQQQEKHNIAVQIRRKSLSTGTLNDNKVGERCRNESVELIQRKATSSSGRSKSSLIVSGKEKLESTMASTKVACNVVSGLLDNTLVPTCSFREEEGNNNLAACLMDQPVHYRSISAFKMNYSGSGRNDNNYYNDNKDSAREGQGSPLKSGRRKLHSSTEAVIRIQASSSSCQDYQQERGQKQQQVFAGSQVRLSETKCSIGDQDQNQARDRDRGRNQDRDQTVELSGRESRTTEKAGGTIRLVGAQKQDKKIEETFSNQQQASSTVTTYLRPISTAVDDIKRSNVLPLATSSPHFSSLSSLGPHQEKMQQRKIDHHPDRKAASLCQKQEPRCQSFESRPQSEHQQRQLDKSTSLASRGPSQPVKCNSKPSDNELELGYKGTKASPVTGERISFMESQLNNKHLHQNQQIIKAKPASQHPEIEGNAQHESADETHFHNNSSPSNGTSKSASCVKNEHLERRHQLCERQVTTAARDHRQQREQQLRERSQETTAVGGKDQLEALPVYLPTEDDMSFPSCAASSNASNAAVAAARNASSPVYRNQLHSFYLYEFFLANPETTRQDKERQRRQQTRLRQRQRQQRVRKKVDSQIFSQRPRKASSLEELPINVSKDLLDRFNESWPDSANDEDNELTGQRGDDYGVADDYGFDYDHPDYDYDYPGFDYDNAIDDDDDGDHDEDEVENEDEGMRTECELEKLAENLADFAQRSGCVHCHCRHQLLILVRNEQILNRLTLKIKQGSNDPAGSAPTIMRQNQAHLSSSQDQTGDIAHFNKMSQTKSNQIFSATQKQKAPAECVELQALDVAENIDKEARHEEKTIDLSSTSTSTSTSASRSQTKLQNKSQTEIRESKSGFVPATITKKASKIQQQQQQHSNCDAVGAKKGDKRRRKKGQQKNCDSQLEGSSEACSSILESGQESSLRSLAGELNEGSIRSSIMKSFSSATRENNKELGRSFKIEQVGRSVCKSQSAEPEDNSISSESSACLASELELEVKAKSEISNIGEIRTAAKTTSDSGEDEEEALSSSSSSSSSSNSDRDEESIDEDLINHLKQEASDANELDEEGDESIGSNESEVIEGEGSNDENDGEDDNDDEEGDDDDVEEEEDDEDIILETGSLDVTASEEIDERSVSPFSTPPPAEQAIQSQFLQLQQREQRVGKTKESLAKSITQERAAKSPVNYLQESLESSEGSRSCSAAQQVSGARHILAHFAPQRLNSAPTMAHQSGKEQTICSEVVQRDSSTNLSSSNQMSHKNSSSSQQTLERVTGSSSIHRSAASVSSASKDGLHYSGASLECYSPSPQSQQAQQEGSCLSKAPAMATATPPAPNLAQRQRRLAVSGASAGSNKRSAELDLDPDDDYEGVLECSSGGTPTNASALSFGKRQASSTLSFDSHQQHYRIEALNFYRQRFNNPNLVHRRHHRHKQLHQQGRQQTGSSNSSSLTTNSDSFGSGSRKALSSSTAAQEIFERSSLRSLSTNSSGSQSTTYFGQTTTKSGCGANSVSSAGSGATTITTGLLNYNEQDGTIGRSQQIELHQQQQQRPLLFPSSSTNQQERDFPSSLATAQRRKPLNSRDASILISFGLDLECSSLDKQDFLRMMNYGELTTDTKPTVVLTKDLIKKSLPKYKRHDDLIIIQEASWEEFKRALPIPVVKEENSPFSIDEDELASLVCQTIQKPTCRRLAVEKTIKNDDFRTPHIELILGDNGIVNHKENSILYRFDITKCMFSFGNIREKMRMAELNCSEEIVVDLFAGIGYFSLPLLIHAKAKHLYACEWNPDAIDAFKKNLIINKIATNRCTIIEGDNRTNRPTDVAQRVILGILPTCSDWMQTAFECIDKSTGAILHCHDLVETPPPVLKSTNNNTSEQSTTNNNLANTTTITSSTSIGTTPLTDSSDQNNKQHPPPLSQSSALLANQSLSSSSSSYSTIEKLTACYSDDKTTSNESDKDTSSPVLLDKPIESCTVATNSLTLSDINTNVNSQNDSFSSSHNEDNTNESIHLMSSDLEKVTYEAKGLALINKIKEDVEAHDLIVKLVHVQPVKSYAPHITHVVFDIKIEPKPLAGKNYESSIFSNIIQADINNHV